MTYYRIIVGEKGNERGHVFPCRASTTEGARRALRRVLRQYGGEEGWGHIEAQAYPEAPGALRAQGWYRL